MDMPTLGWLDSPDSLLTGEICTALLHAATVQADGSPGSIFAYALRCALTTISTAFEDEQGVLTVRQRHITTVVREPLRKLYACGAFDQESPAALLALSDLIICLRVL